MRYFLVASLALWLCVVSSALLAQSSPLYWSAENPKTGSKVHILGSIHFGLSEFYPLKDSILKDFERSSALAVEVDLTALDGQQTAQMMMKHGRYPMGSTLNDHIPRSLQKTLDTVCQALGVNAASFESFRPWLVAIQLVSLQMTQAGFSDALGVDRFFLAEAKTHRKPIIELESLAMQLEIFSNLTPEEEVFFLEQTLSEYELGAGYIDALAKAWRKGQQEILSEMILGAFESKEADAMYQSVFVRRNQRMANKVVKILLAEQKTVFMVVGVGHLLGDDSIITMLQNKGVSIKLIKEN